MSRAFLKAFTSFILTFLLISVIIIAFLSSYLFFSNEAQRKLIDIENQKLVQSGQKVFSLGVGEMVNGTLFLADAIKQIKTKVPPDLMVNTMTQESLLKNYIRYGENIDQIRFIDLNGDELIRFNRMENQINKVASDDLQNKSERYYFLDAVELEAGQVAISKIDLNIENGQIEIPFKPTLRISAPVFDSNNQRIGVLVVNYLANHFLNRIQSLSSVENQKIWMTDNQFDWLIAPEGQQPWAGQLNLQDNNLRVFLPDLYQKLSLRKETKIAWQENNQAFEIIRMDLIDNDSMDQSRIFSRAKDFYLIAGFDLPTNWQTRLLDGGQFSKLAQLLLIGGLIFSFILSFISFRRYQLQEETDFQKELISQFFDRAPDAMMIFSPNGDVIYANKKMAALTGEEEADGEEQESSGFDFATRKQRQQLGGKVLAAEKDLKDSLVVESDLSTRYFNRQGFVIQSAGAGDQYFGLILTEVTDLKEAQHQVMDSEARVRHLLDSAPDAILLSNKAGNILMSNRKAREMFETSEEGFKGMTIDSLVPHPYKTGHKAMRHEYYKHPQQKTMSERPNIQAQSVCGRTFYAEISLSPIKQDGDYQVISIVRDITDRKRLESHLRQSQKMDSLGQLTGGIAHDFNNLLTTIIGNLDLAKLWIDKNRPEHGEPLQNRLDTALNASLKAAKLTRRLLSFSRKEPVSTQIVDIGELIEKELTLFKSASGKLVEFHFNRDKDIWPTQIDPEEMTNALINLISNAKDAMKEGSEVFISVENYQVEENSLEILGVEIPVGEYVALAISDTGTGIPAEIMDKVFEPFFTTKPKHEGTGLGLSQVFGFIKQSEGYIKIYSEEGLGTTFKLFFPKYRQAGSLAQVDEVDDESKLLGKEVSSALENDAEYPSQGDKPDLADNQSKTILIVDDEPDLRMLAAEYLKSDNFNILTAANADDALAVLDKSKVDMVLSDIVMPGKNGFELAKDIIKLYPDMKILFSSGFPEDAVKHANSINKEITMLDKPYRKKELLNAIYHCLEDEKA